MDDILSLLEIYTEAAKGTNTLDPVANNAWVEKLNAAYRLLRDQDEGRAAIVTLMDDPDPHVRNWAAAHSLQWCPEIAVRALETLRDSNGPASFDAKWTLIEYHKGKLTFDY